MSSALLYTLTHAHRHTPVSFSGRVRGLCWERDPPFPHLKDMKFVTVFPLCVSAWTWYSACVWFDACLQVFLFDFALVCASPEMEEGTILCVYLYICVRVCVYMCVSVRAMCACACLVIWPLSDCSKFITKWHQPSRRQMMAGWKGALGLG